MKNSLDIPSIEFEVCPPLSALEQAISAGRKALHAFVQKLTAPQAAHLLQVVDTEATPALKEKDQSVLHGILSMHEKRMQMLMQMSS